MVKDGEEGPKTWEDGHNELKLEMAQMAYVLKNIASMLKAKEKKKESDTPSESEEEDEKPKRKSKNKNDDDRGLKLDIPDFDGEMDPEKFLDWLQSLEQGSMTVTEYIKEFEKMSIVCDLEEKEELRVARFIKGLTPAIAKRVEIQNYEGFNDASSSKAKEIPKEEPKDKGKGVAEPKGSSLRRCFKCQGYGHIANECPQKRALTAQELCDLIPVFVTPEEETVQGSVETDGEGIVYDLDPLSNEECLVLRNLHMETGSAENEQREQIFHTRCKVNRKICNLIIDSGSCANVVARDLVDELKLQTKDRVKPYKLHWLNGENGIQVKKQALVSLSLGPYTDEVWCDIIPMNACHILLGRPWQFDRKVEHDGRANVYSVMKGNVRYNLKPMSPNKIKEFKTKRGSMFMEAREVEEALARGERTYVLMVRELGSVGVCNDRGVQELLEEFRDVFPDELPDGLPPLRGIEHQIDLIPGAALPNKPAYRCNPEEAKELQRQVQELIDRGYVQESLSPCAVPALLVPKKEGTWRMCIDIECDASGVGIGAVLIQEKRPIAYFNEKLNGARLNYSTYDKEFYAIYKTGSSNVVADALSRRHSLLIELDARILGFEHIKELYKSDPEFSKEIIDPTGRAPFEIVYGVNPYLPIDLVPIPKKDVLSFEAKERQAAFLRVCEQVRAQIEKANAKYKEKANKHRKQPVFKEGDLVWLHLRKERFPSKRKNKLMPRADGPFKILECYGSNAYKLELPSEYGGVSATFNVGDLSPYLEDEDLRHLPSQFELELVHILGEMPLVFLWLQNLTHLSLEWALNRLAGMDSRHRQSRMELVMSSLMVYDYKRIQHAPI
ncbi:uncharacterized protein LOC141602227 [Silene latifolia]|uniref:uncharacterized protein LOC141602227 n=1 Tax=Silene latifolia TaxID=37657 RepID=UPI003D77A78B